MKKIIYGIGIITLAIVFVLNIFLTAKLDGSEHITIIHNNIIYIIGLIGLGVLIFFITKKLDLYLNKDIENEHKKKIKKILLIVALSIYIVANILWLIIMNPAVGADQLHVCNLAQTMYRGNEKEFLPGNTYAGIPLSSYIEKYQQQITLAFIYNIFFRIIHYDVMEILRVLNLIGNVLIIFALCKINKQISKKYQTNKVRLLVFILTFISLPMLSTFIYGDIPSIALGLFSVYFIMKYNENEEMKNAVYASIFMMIAFMMRMNSLIFIIATVMYLVINLFDKIKQNIWKQNLIKVGIIIMYIVISIVPSSLIKGYYLNKYNLDKTQGYPNISFLLIAMEEGSRGNGWYIEEIGEKALKNPEEVKEEYKEKIKERIDYFSKNLGYTFKFYTDKIASMWTENTYSAVINNYYIEVESDILTFYQKTLLIIMSLSCIIVLVQNRKNISIDVLFLITIFIGGFTFHILWEAKSRYIIPYVVVLIPVASIAIRNGEIRQITKKLLKKLKKCDSI